MKLINWLFTVGFCSTAWTGLTPPPAQAQTAPSVPNLIAYQGRVTLSGGSPVADGSYPATFTIYNYSSGGANLWTESVSITTNDGTFSHNLGSATALPSTLSIANDSLWLAIVFNGELLSPRTRIVGNAFSLTANHLEMNNGFGSVALRTNPVDHSLSQYGPGNEEQIRLGGQIWPSLTMDGGVIDGTTDDIVISTNNGGGSILQLRKPGGAAGAVIYSGGAGATSTLTLTNGAGAPTVFVDAGSTGDGATQLPGSSVSALEILNESGISSNYSVVQQDLVGPFMNVTQSQITVPSNGYVVAIGTVEVILESISGLAEFSISKFPGSFVAPKYVHTASSSAPTQTVTIHETSYLGAGSYTFYLQAAPTSGTWDVRTRTLTLFFIPTAYGTVNNDSTEVAQSLTPLGDKTPDHLQAMMFHTARMEREMLELQAQARETARRLEELEAAMPRQIPVSTIDNQEN